jgi:hypothetical protein
MHTRPVPPPHRADAATLPHTAQAADVRSIAAPAVAQAQADGFTLIDVRPAEEYEECHPPGALSVPLFGPIVIDSPAKFMKQALFSFNGMKGTDENPKFLAQARARA